MSKNKYLDILPAHIGPYEILGKIGKGGMGDIYKAKQKTLDRVVAIKVLPPQLSRDNEFAKRFEIEAKAISLLQHQNIVTIHECGEDDGYSYIAMQYIDGMDLGNYIAETKVIAVSDIIDFSKQICRGLLYAHHHNVVHRDIKPQNILLDKSNIIHITDFGIAKIFSTTDIDITQTGSTVGTPEYMSPEQAQGKKIDAQSDIYSLGIVMYEMLTRKPPFTANNSMAVAYKQVHEPPIPPSFKRKDTPKQLELIILKAIKKTKRDRYESVEELLTHLDMVDPNERTDRQTQLFRPTFKQTSASAVDQRITDRRSGDRRGGILSGVHQPVFSGGYWKTMLRINWPTWLTIAALGSVLLVYIFKQ
ncbi:MAG: protein kinase [Chitinispirillales bacterium]|jgi:serine/threonine-protein kinase|nr:protein kinase [Chitinispirillales bacterium]